MKADDSLNELLDQQQRRGAGIPLGVWALFAVVTALACCGAAVVIGASYFTATRMLTANATVPPQPDAGRVQQPEVPLPDLTDIPQTVDRSDLGIGLVFGSDDALVTLVEYGDFSCPHCYDLSAIIERLADEDVTSGTLRIVFKPITFVNPRYSRQAGAAAICAAEQGAFWEMHHALWALFERGGPAAYAEGNVLKAADRIGLDQDEFAGCLGSDSIQVDLDNVLLEAQRNGISGTPTLFVNGENVVYRGPDVAYRDLKAAIQAALGIQDS